MRSTSPLSPTRSSVLMYGITALLIVNAVSTSQAGDIAWHTQPAARAVQEVDERPIADQIQLLAERADAQRVVIQFDSPLTEEQRAELKQDGVVLLDYVGANAYFASLHADALEAGRAVSSANIIKAEAIDPLIKLAPMLADDVTPDWAVVSETADKTPVIGVYAMFHRDVDLLDEALPLLEMYGAVIRDVVMTTNLVVAELPQSLIHDLALEDAVQWIEPVLPRMSETNDGNRAISQADDVQVSPYNLDGSGVKVLVYDGGTARSTHNDFGGRLTVYDSSGMANHATHVAGTIGGSGASSGGTYRGMAPNVTLLSYGYEYDGSDTFLYTNPGDIEADYTSAISQGAIISNNSIGANIESNGFPCEYQGNYGATSNLIDSIVRGRINGEPFRIVWANSNERQGSRCDVEGYGDYYSISPPAGAKNHIAIGAVESDSGYMTDFSGWGPMDDGRMRPDVCAPGCQALGDGGVTSTSSYGDSAYDTMCGTSMAAPTATGLAALLIQDFRVQFPELPDPRCSLLKVLFAHTAMKVNNNGPDYQFGYGVIRIQYAIDFMRLGEFDDDQISTGESVEYYVDVTSHDEWMKVTLAWDDYPGTPNVNPTLVNDLDLRVYDPSNNRYYPWTLDPTNPSAAAIQTAEDHLNNIEQVRVRNPVAGLWRIEVHGTNVPEGPQPFSICATPELTPSGVRISYPSGRPSEMAPGVGEEFQVSIRSETENIVSGSPALHFRYNGGDWLEQPLTSLGDNLYRAELPAATCDATPEYYVTAQGSISGIVSSPSLAPTGAFTAVVGVTTTIFEDDFETDKGWTVQNQSLSDGAWDRGDPVGGGDRGDPANDYDGSGRCYLTDNVDDNSDVDDGYTRLLSPTIDMSGGDAEFSFALWYTNNFGADPNNDLFKIHVSNNNGANWTLVETVGPQTPGSSWFMHSFMVGDYVTPTSQVKVRFEASDLNSGSVVEAGVDAVFVGGFGCTGELDDCNENAILDADDIAAGLSNDVNGNGVPDECETIHCVGDLNNDGVINLSDLGQLLAGYGTPSGAEFEDGDMDGDGDVDLSDLSALLAVYGQSCP